MNGEQAIPNPPTDAAPNAAKNAAPRVILHADMDCFFVAVEVLDFPELAGKPVAVGGSPTGRGVVSSASYEARKFGVRSAMPMGKAMRLCPALIRRSGRFERYKELSQAVFEIFGRFSPIVQPISIDEAFIDVSGVQRLFGDGETIAREIRRTVRDELNLVVSIGMAPNKFVAKLASDLGKPDGLTVAPMHDAKALAEWLAPMPIKRMWGVGPKTEPKLRQLGFATFGDLQAFPEEKMRRLLGEHGVHWRQLALGIDFRPVRVEREQAKSIGKETTFSTDVRDREKLRATLSRLADASASRARAKQLEGRTITLVVRFPDFETITRSRTLPTPTDDSDRVFAVAWDLFERHVPADAPIRLIGVRLQNIGARPLRERTRDLFADLAPPPDAAPQAASRADAPTDDDSPKRRQLEATIDEIRQRIGFDAIRRGRELSE